MGTRSLTVVNDDQGKEIVVLYRQYDGYPTGHGAELAEFLKPFTIVNGLSGGQPKRVANGMDCLAAQLVAHFKTGAGDFYLHAAGTRDCGEEYIYTVYTMNRKLWLKVQAGAVTFFGLPGSKQSSMPVIFDGPVGEFNPEQADKAAEDMPTPKNDWADSQQ